MVPGSRSGWPQLWIFHNPWLISFLTQKFANGHWFIDRLASTVFHTKDLCAKRETLFKENVKTFPVIYGHAVSFRSKDVRFPILETNLANRSFIPQINEMPSEMRIVQIYYWEHILSIVHMDSIKYLLDVNVHRIMLDESSPAFSDVILTFSRPQYAM